MTFVGLSEREELEIFSVINSKAKGLSGSLLDYHASRLSNDVRVEDAGLDDDEVLPRDADDQAPTPRQSSLARGSIARRAATHVAVGVVA
jgi:hypothetical protein